MSDFLEQYKANCRQFVRRTPYRLLRLLVAFVAALVLAPLCALAARVTGQPMVGVLIGVMGAVAVLAVWILIERAIPRRVERQNFEQIGSSPFATEAPLPTHDTVVTPEIVHAVGPEPTWQPVEQRPRTSGSGCLLAMMLVGGVTLLSCCGGGLVLLAIGMSVAGHRSGQIAVQEDPLLDLHRQHEQQLEDLIRRQEESLQTMERDHRAIGVNPFGIETHESLPSP